VYDVGIWLESGAERISPNSYIIEQVLGAHGTVELLLFQGVVSQVVEGNCVTVLKQ
jgi:hypothetical protein